LAVPQTVAAIHINVLNNFYNVEQALTELRDYEADPARALLALGVFNEAAVTHANLYITLAEYFDQNDILDEGIIAETARTYWPQFIEEAE
jgi:predicted S18 family serine protease